MQQHSAPPHLPSAYARLAVGARLRTAALETQKGSAGLFQLYVFLGGIFPSHAKSYLLQLRALKVAI